MSNESRHILLGAGGAISQFLASELLSHGESVDLVSRRGFAIEGARSIQADIDSLDDVHRVVAESSTVYLLAGLKYSTVVWQEHWPRIMQNCITACSAKGAKLIFFDNVYAYGRVDGPMTENCLMNPCSRKGEIRARIADQLHSSIKTGGLNAIIARAADFYGPHADSNSIPYIFIFDKLAKGRKAQCLVNSKLPHSYTYTGDCGKALYLLAKTPDACNQVWHLPTASPALTGEEFIGIAAKRLGARSDHSVLRKWMVRLGGLFNRQVSEVYEMLYQNEFEYIFDSSKFEKRFTFTPTPYERGINETIDRLRQPRSA